METSAIHQIHFRTCNLCEAMCGLEIQLENGVITTIKGDKNDPFSRGHVCPKAVALKDIYEDKDRLKQPIKKTENGWEQISWEEAIEEVTKNLKTIQEKYGNNSVGVYQGNPNAHNSGTLLTSTNFTRALKTQNKFSATSADQLPHHFTSLFMLGHQLLLPIPDIDRTNFMLILGANPLASNGSLMTCPDFANRLKDIQKRGGKFIVIDPRKTETAEKADEHFFIKPNSDVLFLLALLHTIFEENLANPKHLKDIVEGWDTIAEIVKPYSPEKISDLIGIEAKEIQRIAKEFAQADKAVCYGRMGVSTQEFGTLSQWLVNLVNIATGNFDSEGGAMFPLPAIDVVGLLGAMGAVGSFGRWKSRVRGLPEFTGELPVSTLAEEILTSGEGQIKAMVTIAGNPVLSTPNGTQLDKALDSLEYMVAIDIYLNETTRHANIILPPTTGLENDHYDLVFHNLAIHNTAKFSPKLFEAGENTMADWQIFRALGKKMTEEENTEKDKKDPLKRLSQEGILDMALRYGPYGSKGKNMLGKENALSLQKLRSEVHGIDLGALKPCLPKRLFTKDKKIQLAPAIIVQDLKRMEESFFGENKESTPFDLMLIGRRHLRSNNSWMHNSLRLVKGKNRCTLMMHPSDATERGLHNEDKVRIASRVGEIEIELEITDKIMQGVVSIPHGWGHQRKGIQLSTAQEHAGVSINDLTDEQYVDQLSGNAAFSAVPVEVNKL